MPEKQNIEWKEIWKDEYLAWICGFANAQGGTLYIGKNDYGGKEYSWKKTFVQRLFSLDNRDEINQLPTWTKIN